MRKILDIGEGVDRHVVFESEPQPRTIKIQHCESRECNKKSSRYLSMPYAQYYLRFIKRDSWLTPQFFVTFSSIPFNIKTRVNLLPLTYEPFLPNHLGYGHICMNHDGLRERPEDYITDFWNSHFCTFRTHEQECTMHGAELLEDHWIPSGIKSFDEWEENTKKDPHYIMNIEWSDTQIDVIGAFAGHNHIFRKWLREQK